jgi:hypothetical protein
MTSQRMTPELAPGTASIAGSRGAILFPVVAPDWAAGLLDDNNPLLIPVSYGNFGSANTSGRVLVRRSDCAA